MDKIWLQSYPSGVPAEIDLDEFGSINDIFDSAVKKYRDKTALINMGKSITYGDLDRLSRDFAGYLLGELKLKKGDRVALMMPNIRQYPVAIFGVLRAGLTVVNTNPMYTAPSSEQAFALHPCLGRLDNKQREVVSLAYLRDLSHGELAEQLKLPLGTVKTWIRRGLDQLRACMARYA